MISFVIIILLFFFGVFKKECKNETCFKKALNDCSPTTYLKLQNLNYYKYTIYKSNGKHCNIKIELKKMATGVDTTKVARLEGKSMKCKIPKTNIQKADTIEISGILNHCTGPLKEGMYEVIIEKLYTLIISNLGNVIGQLETSLKKEI